MTKQHIAQTYRNELGLNVANTNYSNAKKHVEPEAEKSSKGIMGNITGIIATGAANAMHVTGAYPNP